MLTVNEISTFSQLILLDLQSFALAHSLNNKRECEVKGTQYILNHLNYEGIKEIRYNEHGKPCLDSSVNISISHSKGLMGILLNKRESCGLDIEEIGPKAKRVKDKFLSKAELLYLENASEKMYVLYWAVKEALFKIHGKGELIFAEHIRIPNQTLNENEGDLCAEITKSDYEQKYLMAYRFLDKHVLVYLLESTS